MTVVVWSERNELHDPTGTEHDCYVAAPLMCLVYGGKVDYPLGIYTAQEREALERSDTRPDEEGGTPDDADLAIKTRYGLAMHKVAEASLGEAWKVGRALSVGGRLANFPDGSPLRRYAPTYTGGHRVCVIPTGPAAGRWLDPLAPWKYAGDSVSIAQVGLFAKGRAASDLRYVNANEYATQAGGIEMPGFQFQLANPPFAGLVTFDAGVKAYSCLDHHEYVTTQGAVRDGVSAISGGNTSGYIVDLNEGGNVPTQAYFIYANQVTFAPTAPAAATKLAPGIYEVQ
jgi:hypothetical protein